MDLIQSQNRWSVERCFMDHSLLDDLISWSNLSDVPPVPPQPDFDEWSRFVARTLQYFARIDSGFAWMLVEQFPLDVVQLSPWLQTIEIGGAAYPPESMSMIEWLHAVEAVSLIPYTASLPPQTIELCNAPAPIVNEKPKKIVRDESTMFSSEAA